MAKMKKKKNLTEPNAGEDTAKLIIHKLLVGKKTVQAIWKLVWHLL